MKNKKILIIIIVLLVILALCGGAFAYVYFATDLLKSNSQMFAKYGEEVEKSVTEFFNDETAKSYFANKSANNHENSGIVNAKIQSNGDTTFNGEINLSFKGASDVDNGNFEQEININYSNTDKFTFKLVKDNETFALGSDEVANKYVGIKNEKLNEFASKMGLDTTAEIPDSIEVNKSELTAENINKIANKYLQLVKGQLTESNFTKNSNNSYTFTIGSSNLQNIILKCLNEARNDADIMEILGTDETSAYQENIDNMIENVSDEDFSNISLKITLTKNETTNAIEMRVQMLSDDANSDITISIENAQTIIIKQNYSSSSENAFTGETTQNSGSGEYAITKEATVNKSKYTLTSNIDNSTLKIGVELDNISANGATEKVSLSYSDDNNELSAEYNNAVTFKNKVNVTELNDDNSVVLNNYSPEDLSSLLQQLFVQIVTVNSQKIQNAYGF